MAHIKFLSSGDKCRLISFPPPLYMPLSLLLAVPPEKPRVYDERGQEVRLKLGPYKIGETVALKCSVAGGA